MKIKKSWKEIINVIKEFDMIEYVRNDGEIDVYVLNGEVMLKGDEVVSNGSHYGVDESYNKAMYVYIKQDNGDYHRYTIHEEAQND